MILLLLTLLSPMASAAEFPEREVRLAEVRLGLESVGEELAKVAGRGAAFDAALALQNCDAIDRALTPQMEARQKARQKAKREAEVNVLGWETRLKDSLGLSPSEKVPLAEALRVSARRAKTQLSRALPCNDEPSMELIDILAADENAADEGVINLCVRLVKALRKSGECGRSQAISPTKVSIPAP